MNYTIASPGFRMEGLEPGQRNDFEIKSYCLMSGERKGQAIEYKLFSNAATFRTRSYLYIFPVNEDSFFRFLMVPIKFLVALFIGY